MSETVSMLKSLEIGKLQLKFNMFVAPLAGVSDYPFRRMLRRWGAELTFMEMLPVTTLVANPQKCARYYKYKKDEHPVGVQLVGKDPSLFLKALDILHQHMPDLIDLNFSCPVRKIMNNGSGAAMLRDPERIEQIAKLLVHRTSIPVSAKIRLGVDRSSINALDVAKRLQDAGISMITVHARTADQKYSGPVAHDILAWIKQELSIPVIGNGGVYTIDDALSLFKNTNVDGLQIGTGILGRYWFIKELKEMQQINLSPVEKLKELLQHYQYQMEEYDEKYAIMQMRKHVVWLFKSIPEFESIKKKIIKSEKFSEIYSELIRFI